MAEKENICWIRCKLIIELAGFPESHINESLILLADKFGDSNKGIVRIIRRNINEARRVSLTTDQSKEAVEESMIFSGFVELEAEVAGMANLFGVVIDWLPSSVEIISPEEFRETARNVADLANDLAGKLHKYDSIIKMLRAENKLLKNELERSKSGGAETG